jgi:beta-galactosidase/beta-glucuronidase
MLDGVLSRLPKQKPRFVTRRGKGRKAKRRRVRLPAIQPKLTVRLRSPTGRITRKTLQLKASRKGRRRQLLEMRVPAPKLWSPDRPQLYDARLTLSYKGRIEQYERKRIGLRSVTVKGSQLFLNNRAIQIRGASIHDDFSGVGAALTGPAMDTTIRELKELGANVTRSHYVLSEAMLSRLDRAGIMVWNQAPVWQRDHGANLLRIPVERRRALAQEARTVKAARSHPSVITHSVANELTFTPDRKPWTRRFLIDAAEQTRDLDPTLPVSLDIKGRPGFEEQFVYQRFDMLGINQYFGWYPWVEDFNMLEPYLREMHDLYPGTALVMTEFGAEGRPDMALADPAIKGSYGFQAMHVARTLDLVDRLPFMNGAIHWTLREFEIYPGWRGGAVNGPGPNTRHHKGLLTYGGGKKPAWSVARERFLRKPLYR